MDVRTPSRGTDAPDAPGVNRMVASGAAAGVVGAAAQAAVLLAVGEPALGDAIALEESHPHAEGHEELYSRDVQTVGGVLGLVVVGALMGVVFGVVFARTRHLLPGAVDWVRARWLALLAFVVLAVVPLLKYPPNPPGVGDPDTIGARTASYLALLAVTVLAVVLAVATAPRLRARVPAPLAAPAAVAVAVAAVAVAVAVLPPGPAADVPADLLWRFRAASVAGQAALWSGLAVAFGVGLTRRVSPRRTRRP